MKTMLIAITLMLATAFLTAATAAEAGQQTMTRDELVWCAAEEVRLATIDATMNNTVKAEIDLYNDRLDAWNRNCTGDKVVYVDDDEAAKQIIAAHREAIVAEGREIIEENRRERRDGSRPACVSAAQPPVAPRPTTKRSERGIEAAMQPSPSPTATRKTAT